MRIPTFAVSQAEVCGQPGCSFAVDLGSMGGLLGWRHQLGSVLTLERIGIELNY